MSDETAPQANKFRDLARQLECDEDEATFEDQVRADREKSETRSD